MCPAPAPSKLDSQQILPAAFEESTGRLRTTATATISGITEVSINQADDSIRIGDGTNLITSTNVAGKQGLDVNVISSTPSVADVNLNGLNAFQTTQYTLGLTATQLTPTPLTDRSSMIIKVSTTTPTEIVWINDNSGMTVGDSFPLFNGDTLQLDLTPLESVYVLATVAGQKVYVLEIGG
jgi:hypothetical protein